LEATITKFARRVDELKSNLFTSSVGRLVEDRFSQGEDSLSGSSGGTLDHEEVFADHSVVMEATHGVDRFFGHIELSRATLAISAFADSVDLFVDIGSVEVTSLTSSGNSVLDSARMPSTDTSDLSQSLVGLTRKSGNSPTFDDTLETVTFGDSDDIDHFVLVENSVDIDGFLEKVFGEVDLLGDGTTVNLDLHQVSLLLSVSELSDLGVGQDSNDGAVLLDLSEIGIDGLVLVLGKVLESVFGKGLLLGLVPVLVEASSDIVAQVLGPDSLEVSDTKGSLDVSDNTDWNHGRGFNDGDGFDNLLLVQF